VFNDPRILAGLVLSAALMALAVWIVFQRRMTPKERERRRRLFVNRSSRTTEATITEATGELIHYEYELRGVRYCASQDVTALQALLPPDPTRLVGAVSAKYDPRNPANSIVLSESWSGLVKNESCYQEEGGTGS